MQPLRVEIAGDYWDSQIYRGRLYLWSVDNTVSVYDWDRLISSRAATNNSLALTCAFIRSDLPYQADSQLFLSDPEMLSILLARFSETPASLQFDDSELQSFLIGRMTSPFGELHDDSEIVLSRVYAITERGLFSTTAHRPTRVKNPLSSRCVKHWDGRGATLKAGYGQLAIAALDDGLWELPVDGLMWAAEPSQTSKKPTNICSWVYSSIYGSSSVGEGFLAAYDWNKDTPGRWVREKVGLIDAESIFHHRGVSWGGGDKICLAASGELQTVEFNQSELRLGHPFSSRPAIDIQNDSGAVTAGAVAMFGTIIEYQESLLVKQSDGESLRIEGSPSRWRTFPRSRRYQNQLHVIHSDRLVVYSFNHDYLVNQDEKMFGFRSRSARPSA